MKKKRCLTLLRWPADSLINKGGLVHLAKKGKIVCSRARSIHHLLWNNFRCLVNIVSLLWFPGYNTDEPHHDKPNKMACAPSEDSDQPAHPINLVRVFAVHMKKVWVERTAKTLIRLGGCPGWSESSMGAQSFCWFCHEAAQMTSRKVIWSTFNNICPDSSCEKESFEPSHESMVCFVLRKLILQTHTRRHPEGLDAWFWVGPFVYFHTWCVRTAKALARLCGFAGSPEPSLVAYVISTMIPWAGSFDCSDIYTWRRDCFELQIIRLSGKYRLLLVTPFLIS